MKRPADDEAVLGVAGTVVYRLARREDDEALAGLDGSFTTDSVFEVTVQGGWAHPDESRLRIAKELGARHVWLEVTHINAPAVRACLRMGFTFCGLDTTLYGGTASTGEQALFLSRRVR